MAAAATGTAAAGAIAVAASGPASQPVLRSAASAPTPITADGPYYGDPATSDDSYYDDSATVAVVPDSGGDSSAYCAQRYRSYDPASGTYLGYDGLRHPCP